MHAPPLPEHLQIEVSGACNLRCRMCLVRYAPAIGRREGALAYEDYLELVDALPGLRRLTLQGLGEPLLSPHLLDMIRHAVARGIHVGFNTNGVLLTRAVARALLVAGTGHVHVSLHGATAPPHEDVRPPAPPPPPPRPPPPPPPTRRARASASASSAPSGRCSSCAASSRARASCWSSS